MNKSIAACIEHAESVIAAIRTLCELPAAQPFHFVNVHLDTGMIQFFPTGHKRAEGWRDIAKPFALAIGGSWQVGIEGECWECLAPTFPGLTGTKIVLHYIEPVVMARVIDLSEPATATTTSEHPAEAVQI